MVAKLEDLKHLPNWPRMLSREQAAAYVGVSPNTFESEVKKGMWPQAIRRGDSKKPRLTWDRIALDKSIDGGIIAPIQAIDGFEARRAAAEASWYQQNNEAPKRRRRGT